MSRMTSTTKHINNGAHTATVASWLPQTWTRTTPAPAPKRAKRNQPLDG